MKSRRNIKSRKSRIRIKRRTRKIGGMIPKEDSEINMTPNEVSEIKRTKSFLDKVKSPNNFNANPSIINRGKSPTRKFNSYKSNKNLNSRQISL